MEAGEPHRETLREYWHTTDVLGEMAAAADAVDASIDRWANLRVERVAATEAIALAVDSGRQAIAMLDPVVLRLLKGNSSLTAGWNAAKRVGAVPTPARNVKARKAPGSAPSVAAPSRRKAKVTRARRRPRGT